ICNCVTNYKWVFKVKDKKKKDIAWRYTLVWGTSIALNTIGTAFIKESFDINYLYSKIITAICVAICWNYQMQRKFVFKKI
ncbi:MAG: GtrA family protein, partial [Prevotella nanceiensis]|uniref:GtrA family protein n=1 Tax=Hoylesella nanceiensis TaxID=425941 RepID=UPI001CAABB1C